MFIVLISLIIETFKMKKIKINCPICNSNNYTVKYLPTSNIIDPKLLYGASSGIPGTQRLVVCDKCSLIYENPRYPEKIILKGYEDSDEHGHDSQFKVRVSSFLKALVRNKNFMPPIGAKILDIGTAGGAFLDAAENYGYEAWGMEPSSFLVDKGKKRGLKIEQGTIDSHNFKQKSFDMICLWDVLEHLANPRQSLLQIKKLLKDDGVLLINYPDISTLQAKLFRQKFWWIISVHLTHFTPTTISKICELTGFEVTRFNPYWQTLEFGYLAKMAVHYKVPFAKLGERLLPDFIKNIPIPYYASQTTAIARIKN